MSDRIGRILYMEYSAGGIRGGDVYHKRFHSFLCRRYKELEPRRMLVIEDRLKNPFGHCLRSLSRVKKVVPDLAIFDVSSGIRNILAARYLKREGRKILVVVLEQRIAYKIDNSLIRWLMFKIEKYLIGKADLILTISRFSADLARKKSGCPDIPVIIAPPGTEIQISQFDKTTAASHLPNGARLLFIGACVWNKGLVYLVEAMGKLKDMNIQLDIVGRYDSSSPYFRRLKEVISRYGIDDKIIFHGFVEREEVKQRLRDASIYVHPSLMEGFGMALAEAMSYGLPIVTTTVGAIPEIIDDGVNGLLVPPRDSESIAAAIRRLILNPELINNMSGKNLERVKSLPSWDDFERILDEQLCPIIERLTGISPGLTDRGNVQ